MVPESAGTSAAAGIKVLHLQPERDVIHEPHIRKKAFAEPKEQKLKSYQCRCFEYSPPDWWIKELFRSVIKMMKRGGVAGSLRTRISCSDWSFVSFLQETCQTGENATLWPGSWWPAPSNTHQRTATSDSSALRSASRILCCLMQISITWLWIPPASHFWWVSCWIQQVILQNINNFILFYWVFYWVCLHWMF